MTIHLAYHADLHGRRFAVRPYRVLRCVNPDCANPGQTHVALLISDGDGGFCLEDPAGGQCPECAQPMLGEAGSD